jgi:acyl carrier protein phosphodiesterase
MNFLTHLFFSQNQNEQTKVDLIIGNTLKSSNLERYNSQVLRGTLLDKRIESYFRNSEDFQRSMSRLSVKYSRYREFIIKVYYDHLLASAWNSHTSTPLDSFSNEINEVILENLSQFPYKIRKFAPQMVAKNWITALTSIEGTHQYIKVLLKTERFSINLEQSLFELVENYYEYRKDFENFFDGLKAEMQPLETEFAEETEKEFILVKA